MSFHVRGSASHRINGPITPLNTVDGSEIRQTQPVEVLLHQLRLVVSPSIYKVIVIVIILIVIIYL